MLFANAIVDLAPKNINIEKRINRIIGSGLRYDNGRVYNETGSFGCTYLTMQEGKTFVAKVPKNFSENFSREFNVMHNLHFGGGSEYLPFVTQFNKEKGLFLEEVAIDSLDHYIRTASINIDEKITIALSIINAVVYIHSRGIIHRDLHPGNIFKLKEDKNSQKWKLADFGLAFDMNNNVSCGERHTGCYGDIDFISPDQLNNFDTVSFQNDIYSIGKLLNFIFTKNPKNTNHIFKVLSEKCCSNNAKIMYSSSAAVLSNFLNTLSDIRNY